MEIVENYSEKSFVLLGEETKLHKDEIKVLGGKFNGNLKCGPGWIFSNKNIEKIKDFVKVNSKKVKVKTKKQAKEKNEEEQPQEQSNELEKLKKKYKKVKRDKKELLERLERLEQCEMLRSGKNDLISEICQWTGRNYDFYKTWSYEEIKQRHEGLREEIDCEIEIKPDDFYYGKIPNKCTYEKLVKIMAQALINFRKDYHKNENVNYENVIEIVQLWFEHDENSNDNFSHLVSEEKYDEFEKEVLTYAKTLEKIKIE